jgi:hypothetical protein
VLEVLSAAGLQLAVETMAPDAEEIEADDDALNADRAALKRAPYTP